MIMEVTVSNCYIFSNQVTFSLVADMRTKKLASNVYSENNFNILKVAGVYGPNNVGKTCLLKCIKNIRNILLHEPIDIKKNFFTRSAISQLAIKFLEQNKEYNYQVKYDTERREYAYECFSKIEKDNYGNESIKQYFLRDGIKGVYECDLNPEITKMLPLISKSDILIYLLDSNSFKEVDEMKRILQSFASKIDIVDMNNIPIEKTLSIMKNKDDIQERVVDFIKNADVNLEDYRYLNDDEISIKVSSKETDGEPNEKVLDKKIEERIRLTSIYNGHPVPSLLFDSTGTKKIAALASYIVAAIEQGRILIIDELDSSLHFKLTRAIVAMFNNELNTNAQMVFTVHDISLMDCKKLFRKEQIWFLNKDKENTYLYSLADFTANDGVRDTSDIFEKYRKGVLGAIPEPELINTLLSIKGNKKEMM